MADLKRRNWPKHADSAPRSAEIRRPPYRGAPVRLKTGARVVRWLLACSAGASATARKRPQGSRRAAGGVAFMARDCRDVLGELQTIAEPTT